MQPPSPTSAPAARAAVPDRVLRVAVLGGTGFLGHPVCAVLRQLGHEVVVVARGSADAPAGQVTTLDLAAAAVDEVTGLFRRERVDAVVNAAGGMWGLTDEQMVDANLTLAQKVIEAVAAQDRHVRLVQLGSVHEYGLAPIGTSFTEDTPPAPVNAYSELKLRCTEAVTEASTQGRIDGVTLRIGNVTGAGQPRVSLLGVVAEQLLQAYVGERPAVLRLGPLGSLRDFVNLSDAVGAIVAAVTIRELPERVFNIGTGRATSAREMVRMLIEASAVPTELIEAAPSAPDSTWQQMRIDRARQLLGWSPSSDLGEGIKELWEHHAESASS